LELFVNATSRIGSESLMRRSKEELMVALLKCCVAEWQSITHLMALTNLPHKLLTACLNRLLSVGLLEAEVARGRRRIHTTAKGVAALNSYRNAIALLNGEEAKLSQALELADWR
jgi:predicted transcriptional regulator